MKLTRPMGMAFLLATGIFASDIAYIGLSAGAAPSFEKRFDQLIRDGLNVHRGISLAKDNSLELIKRRINFGDYPAVSRTLVEKLVGFVPDSTILIWGAIRNYTIEGRRSYLVRTVIHGSVTVSLHIYSLSFQKYAFTGDVTCEAEIPKGWLFFGSARKELHISAQDRNILIGKLSEKAAQKAIEMIGAVARSEGEKINIMDDIAGIRRYEDGTAAEVFTLPSVEAPMVETSFTDSADTQEIITPDTNQPPERIIEE